MPKNAAKVQSNQISDCLSAEIPLLPAFCIIALVDRNNPSVANRVLAKITFLPAQLRVGHNIPLKKAPIQALLLCYLYVTC